MREFKFRAWITEISQMIEHNTINVNDFVHKTMPNGDINPSYCGDRFILMQYTGLKDKNGVEIYEGDILIAPYMNGKPCKVIYSEGLAKFTMDGRFNFTIIDKNLEVIGNIYENKELLND